MSDKEKIKVAKQYIDKQLASMKNHGCAPKGLTSNQCIKKWLRRSLRLSSNR